ncbi:hypothetical protein E3983_03515 [Legionella israelensis]|uniref:Ras-GEF domain-containing protein n=1 Tax=Legionella israelensis TaxID=454 RepID=A0AAX1EEP6_9GAMM|nr:RasGEF domain-containing protein [Legionella israelensis]QBR83507.1 hypothetical protein E3983_03515 [Legionella israelensis]
MPELTSNAYRDLKEQFDYFFASIKQHKKKDRKTMVLEAQEFFNDFSESLLDYSRQLFVNLPKEEIINANDENFSRISDYYNNLSIFTVISTAQQEDPAKRVFYFDMWIQLMNYCYRKGDLTSAYAIYTGLNSNNLADCIDMKKISTQSRLIFKEFQSEYLGIMNGLETIKVQNDWKARFKGTYIPLIIPLNQLRENRKVVYQYYKDEFESMQRKLNRLDQKIARINNRIKRGHWKQKYKEKNFLAETIFEYTSLLATYDQMLEGREKKAIAKAFQDDYCVMHLSEYLETALAENKAALKEEPDFDNIIEMLEEVANLRKPYLVDDPEGWVFDNLMFDFVKDAFSSSKTKKHIGKAASKVFENIAYPSPTNAAEEDFMFSTTSEETQTEEYYELTHRGLELVRKLSEMIESYDSNEMDEDSHHSRHLRKHGFFKGNDHKRSNDIHNKLSDDNPHSSCMLVN